MSFDSKKSDPSQSGLDRRSFLQLLGVAFSVAALPELEACGVFSDEKTGEDVESLAIAGSVSVVRPEDLLVLTFNLVNLRRDASTNRLVKTDTALDSYLLVDFPPQVIIEDAFNPGSQATTPFAASRIGGRSRLAFKLPTTFAGDDYTLERLLGICATADLVIPQALVGLPETAAAAAAPDTTLEPLLERAVVTSQAPVDPAAAGRLLAMQGFQVPAPHAPSGPAASVGFTDRTVSYVEMPFRLLLSPGSHGAFGHATKPITTTDTTELWHSYLGTRLASGGPIDEKNAFLRTARAVWTRDSDSFQSGNATDPPVAKPSLDSALRQKIVSFTSGPTNPVPLQVDRMMLSALGGYLDVKGDFTGFNDWSLLRWSHKITGGREQFVETLHQGITLPFGNSATCTVITKRSDDANDGPVGTLFQWAVVRILEPVRRFPIAGSAAQMKQRRQFPFLSVEMRERRFVVQSPANPENTTFWAHDLNGQPIYVTAVGFDCMGNPCEMQVPLVMMTGPLQSADAQRAAYQTQTQATLGALPHQTSLAGKRVAYAPSRTHATTFSTLAFGLDLVKSSDDANQVTPVFADMTLDVESVKRFTDGQPRKFKHHAAYLASGLPKKPGDPNQSQYLLSYLPADPKSPFLNVKVTGRPDGGTGFVAPNVNLNAIAVTGPVNDGTTVVPGTMAAMVDDPTTGDGGFNPKQYLGLAEDELKKIQILGVFPITDIIKAIDPNVAQQELAGLAENLVTNALRYAPKFVADGYNEIEHLVGSLVNLKSQLETLYVHGNEILQRAQGTVTEFVSEKQKTLAQIQADINAVIAATKALYGVLGTAVDNIRNLDVTTLLGVELPGGPKRPATTTLEDFRTKAKALRDALGTLNDDGAKATMDLGFGTGPATGVPFNVVSGVFDAVDKKLKAVEDIVGTVNDDVKYVEKLVSDLAKLFTTVEQALETARDLTLKLEWQPKIGSWIGGSAAAFVPSSDHILTLDLEVRAKATKDKAAGMDVSCRLDSFHFYLGGTNKDAPVTLSFDHLLFKKEAGKKPDVDVVFGGITFGGPLSFLEVLRRIIPLDGFSDPPYLEVDTSGIKAGFTLAVPNVAIGMFSLENIKISADLVVPFFSDGGPAQALTFSFAFCDRDHPFLVTVAMLGGGGYFLMSVTPEGIEHIEASISVGAQLAIDFLGVAHGSISIMAGMTFTYDKSKHEMSLTAFLCLHGELDVLGLISISVELRIDMTYDFISNKLTARAVLHVSVHVAFFGISVDLPFERKFAGSNGDPTLRELMGASDGSLSPMWDEYCMAFT